MADKWNVSGRLGGGAAIALPMLVGSGGWTKGDPLVVSSGALVVATGGTDTTPIKFVAAETATSGATGMAYALTQDTVIRATKSGSPVSGGKYGITETTLLPDGTNTTQTKVQVLNLDEATATTVEFVSLGWIA